ncbi:hypothetical protein HNE05_03610 [Aquipseudomonas campi]|uniref:Uncharacterized protein n=1 Tax=Aquipseudomonas campi TaxID=2731681 RepID=A0A6M8FE77_9GAMM|nr:hypothetical protein [Pseudomonas campi]QKE62482.1 hypothetical protein HNE05_03610 [Pseudomonas campi]
MSANTSAIDAHKKTITAGSFVRIIEIPTWLTHDLPEQEVQRLRQCEGSIMKILEVDKYGYIWFGTNNEGRWFCLKPDEVEAVGN